MNTFAPSWTRWSAPTVAALLAAGSLCGAHAQSTGDGRFPVTDAQRPGVSTAVFFPGEGRSAVLTATLKF